MTDNIAVLDGFTRQIMIVTNDAVIFAMVKPDTLFTSTYRAWDSDEQAYITVHGKYARWNICYATDVDR